MKDLVEPGSVGTADFVMPGCVVAAVAVATAAVALGVAPTEK